MWDAVEGTRRFREDKTALAAIPRAVPPEMHSTLAVKTMTKQAWDAISSVRVGDARVHEAKA
jgi:hypothetical protein